MSPSKQLRPVARGASLTLLLVGICGCDFGSEQAMTLGNDCFGDDDCVQGVCDQEICIDDSASEVTVVVEVLRGSSDTATQRATPTSWVFGPESFSGASARNYVLPATRQVLGVVRWQGIPVPASLRFTRRTGALESELPAVPVEVDTLRQLDEENDAGGVDYITVLTVGQTYDVAIVPGDDVIETLAQATAIRSLPPIYTSIQLDDAVDGEPFQFDVRFPEDIDSECGENQLFGCTLKGTVLSFDGESENPAVGLQVRAVEKESGRVVSSIGETNELGDFAIRVSDVAKPYAIRVTSSLGSDPFPSVSVDPDLAFASDPTKRLVLVPRVASIRVTGAVRDEAKRAVPGATVRFSSNGIFEGSQLGLEGSFNASATTNNEGSFSVQLLPGLYSMIVTPPDDSRSVWAPFSREALVAEGVQGLDDLVLPSQIVLSGSCTTFMGDPAGGVTVLARARGELGELQRSRETVSSQEGIFQMGVDAGRYDMSIRVADATGFPWLIEPELVMSAEQGDVMRDYTLPPPIVVRGTLRSAADTVVPGAQIRAYVLESDGDEMRSIQVAETVSAGDGSYRILISPTLGER